MYSNYNMNESQNQGLQTLKDVSKTGKDRKWRERKLRNIELA
ncbi:replication protein [Streptococcus mitis]|nr:replication protein [Streptococcus mitis]